METEAEYTMIMRTRGWESEEEQRERLAELDVTYAVTIKIT